MAKTDCCGSNRSLTAKIVFYTIFKPQSNHSGLYVNNVKIICSPFTRCGTFGDDSRLKK